MGYERVEGPITHPLAFADEARCHWCETCEDWLPEDNLCEHVTECWNCTAAYVSEGDEEDRCPDCAKIQHECEFCNGFGGEQCITCGQWVCEECGPGHIDERGELACLGGHEEEDEDEDEEP